VSGSPLRGALLSRALMNVSDGHTSAVDLKFLSVRFRVFTTYSYRQIQDLRISLSLTRQYPQSSHSFR